jgi:hypothetical protein
MGSRGRGARTLWALITVVAVLVSACASSAPSDSTGSAAQQNKAKLDAALQHAQTSAGVPPTVLQPIETQERALAAGIANGSDKSGQAAASGYAQLYTQVVALEQMTPDQAKAKASSDLQALTQALQAVQDQGFVEAATFQPHVQQAQQQLDAATTKSDYFAADGYILDQTAAVTQIIPVYHQIQALGTLVDAQAKALGSTSAPLQCAIEDPGLFWQSDADLLSVWGLDPSSAVNAGTSTHYVFQSWPSQDLQAFRAATDGSAFADLSALVLAQTSQLTADSVALLPQQVAAAVNAFQADVQTYQQDGGKDPSFQQQASQDAQTLASANTLASLTTLAKTVQLHRQAFALPLLKVRAPRDMQTLTNLVDQANAKKTVDSLDGGYNVAYPDGYEYIGLEHDSGVYDWTNDAQVKYDTEHAGSTGDIYAAGSGIGDARFRLANAQTLDDYQAVETEIQMFTVNVQALLTNVAQMPKDNYARNAWSMQAHQTDLDLINYYGLQNTRVIVVSLREQKARLYENGQLAKYNVTGNSAGASLVPDPKGRVDAFDVTTGAPNLPSVPGIHCVIPYKQHDYLDKSPLPPTSPYYYKPTPIHFGFQYSYSGYFLHDAWWRDGTQMGYLTNLPHYDPEAFNGGSHGCINFHYVDYANNNRPDMAIVYAFVQEGTPVIVY